MDISVISISVLKLTNISTTDMSIFIAIQWTYQLAGGIGRLLYPDRYVHLPLFQSFYLIPLNKTHFFEFLTLSERKLCSTKKFVSSSIRIVCLNERTICKSGFIFESTKASNNSLSFEHKS
jgi:hypothetical protein